MKKVLIADDELLVRVGLKTTIPWEQNGFIVVGEAKNGKEAIELFEKHDPDILVTDIRMPIISGLELIKELKSRKKSLKVVILTHYDDFNYAKEAITFGASEYLLKSDLSADNLLDVLNRISNDIGENSGENKGVSIDSDELDKVNTNNAEQIIKILKNMVNDNYDFEQSLSLENESWRFKHKLFSVSTVKICFDSTKKSDYNRELFRETIDNISKLVLRNDSIIYYYAFYEDLIVYLLNYDNDINSDKMIDLMESLKNNISQFLDTGIDIGLSRTASSIDEVPKLVKESKAALNLCFFEKSGVAVFDEALGKKKKENNKIDIEVLRSCVKTLDSERLNDYIDSVFDELLRQKDIDNVKNVFIDFLSQAKIISAEFNLKNEPALSESKFDYSNFDKLHTFSSIRKYITYIFYEMLNRSDEDRGGKYSYIINKCIDYVKNNYAKDITLADVAESVQISRSYLSLLFKQETGINFSNFLTNCRIEKSKKMLKDTNYKIYEIAERVGFDNPYYFSKVFKDTTGMTCKEFKRLNSESYTDDLTE